MKNLLLEEKNINDMIEVNEREIELHSKRKTSLKEIIVEEQTNCNNSIDSLKDIKINLILLSIILGIIVKSFSFTSLVSILGIEALIVLGVSVVIEGIISKKRKKSKLKIETLNSSVEKVEKTLERKKNELKENQNRKKMLYVAEELLEDQNKQEKSQNYKEAVLDSNLEKDNEISYQYVKKIGNK